MANAKKALIVEDDVYLGKALSQSLTKSSFEIQLITNGNDVMTKLEAFFPDIILLDLMLPGKDGFQILAELKANPKYKDIPVLVLSNKGQKSDIDKCMELGAKDYTIKSNISIFDLETKIKSIVEGK